jgi:sulfide dehydrogenase cytochrome subunit
VCYYFDSLPLLEWEKQMGIQIFLLAIAANLFIVLTTQLVRADQVPAAILVSTCFSCHGDGGNGARAMPSINGMKASKLEIDMKAFRNGKRKSTIMQRIAKGFTEDEIKVISEFIAKHAK